MISAVRHALVLKNVGLRINSAKIPEDQTNALNARKLKILVVMS
jgi:hypothetical protein